jgi:hypothetical protein
MKSPCGLSIEDCSRRDCLARMGFRVADCLNLSSGAQRLELQKLSSPKDAV